MNLNLYVYSKYRTQIMGLAAIMIILCHVRGLDYSQVSYMKKIIWLGNYGVELFLFVSGLGMYHSLNQNDEKLVQWYKRRYLRITIPFVLITTAIYPFRFVLGVYASLPDFLLSITTLEFWLYHRGAWYVAMLFPLYLFTPCLVNELKSKYKYLIMSVMIIMLLFVSRVHVENNIICNIQFVLVRIPFYILGIGLAPLVMSKYNLKIRYASAMFMVGMMIWHYLGVSFGGGIVIVLLTGFLVNIIVENRIVNKVLTFVGTMSLESYLTNIYLGHIIMKSKKLVLFGGGKILMVIVVGILTAYIFNKMSNHIIDKIKKCHTSIF